MNHFSYPLTIVQINIFVEPQNIFPNQNPRPQTIEPAPPPVFLTIECPPGIDTVVLADMVRAARFAILDKVMQMAGLRGSQDPGGLMT